MAQDISFRAGKFALGLLQRLCCAGSGLQIAELARLVVDIDRLDYELWRERSAVSVSNLHRTSLYSTCIFAGPESIAEAG